MKNIRDLYDVEKVDKLNNMQSNKNIDYKNALNEQVYPCSDALRPDCQGWFGAHSLNYAIPQYIKFTLPLSNIF